MSENRFLEELNSRGYKTRSEKGVLYVVADNAEEIPTVTKELIQIAHNVGYSKSYGVTTIKQ